MSKGLKKLPPAAAELRLAKIRATRESKQRQFRLLWRVCSPEITLQEEAVLFPSHPWRYDFAHSVAKVVIEVQGGIWMQRGAHNTGSAILRDTRKARHATLQGWAVFHVCPEDINTETVLQIARFVRTRAIQLADPYQEAK